MSSCLCYSDIIYMAPSGVQKEMIQPCDVFECDLDGKIVCGPSSQLKLTECAPLFMNAYNLRNAGQYQICLMFCIFICFLNSKYVKFCCIVIKLRKMYKTKIYKTLKSKKNISKSNFSNMNFINHTPLL